MGNIIKTAIITIIISFISGLLLEYYKNLAPRILCNIRNSMPIKIDNKKLCAYIIAVSNVSNKTIHDLTLYIQSPRTNLRAIDAKITKGLKFDSSMENNTLDVYIPFLSKDDKFSVTVYAENQHTMSKPVIVIRSPENFKQIDRLGQNGILSSLFNVNKNVNQTISKPETRPSNEKDDFTMVMNRVSGDERTLNKGNKKTSNNKKAMIIILSITLLAFVGFLGKSYLKSAFANTPTPDIKTNAPTQSTDGSSSSEKATKNTGSKASNGKTTVNTNSKTSAGGSTENTNSKTSTGETTVNAGSNTSTGGTTKNTDSKAPTEGTTKNTDSKSSTEGSSTVNSDPKTPTGDTPKNTDSKAPTGGTTTVNSSSKTSTESTGN